MRGNRACLRSSGSALLRTNGPDGRPDSHGGQGWPLSGLGGDIRIVCRRGEAAVGCHRRWQHAGCPGSGSTCQRVLANSSPSRR